LSLSELVENENLEIRRENFRKNVNMPLKTKYVQSTPGFISIKKYKHVRTVRFNPGLGNRDEDCYVFDRIYDKDKIYKIGDIDNDKFGRVTTIKMLNKLEALFNGTDAPGYNKIIWILGNLIDDWK
jgi:hypothetical protein